MGYNVARATEETKVTREAFLENVPPEFPLHPNLPTFTHVRFAAKLLTLLHFEFAGGDFHIE